MEGIESTRLDSSLLPLSIRSISSPALRLAPGPNSPKTTNFADLAARRFPQFPQSNLYQDQISNLAF